jgi:hypothetical protein
MTTFRAHYDGRVLVPDEPVGLPRDRSLLVRVDESTGATDASKPPMTAGDLLNSPLVGLWADRGDSPDGLTLAQQLRAQAQNRGHRL